MLELAYLAGHGGDGFIAAVHGDGNDGHAPVAVGNAQTADDDVGILMKNGVQGGGGLKIFHDDADNAEAVFFNGLFSCEKALLSKEER